MLKRKLISFDWAMKKLLRSKANFEILEGFLSELLGDEIKILELLESESNKDKRRDKSNRVDLKVKNLKSEIIIIEVQYEREFDYLQRILFGASKAITEHLDEGEPYSKVAKVISISILYFDLGHGSDYVYYGVTSFRGLHKQDILQLSEDQQELYQKNTIPEVFPEYYLIKVNKFDDIARNTPRDTLDEWIYFLKNAEIREEFRAKGLKKAKQELDILKLPEEERIAYERYQDDLHYQASMVESTYTIGMKKGEKKGRKEGREEGKKEGYIEIASNLISAGLLDLEGISKVTGLSLDEITNLKDKTIEE
jgi:predicted transposase/invertase (TIGR01784 family)